jgi:hypothetical protein
MDESVRERIFAQISAEREYQNGRWGNEFDKKNTPNDWVTYIVCYLGKAVTLPWNGPQFRSALVKVAALAVAAIEWYDATDGNMPKRHYD